MRYSSDHLTLTGNTSGWNARLKMRNFSITFGHNYADLSATLGYGINNNGMISGFTLTNDVNVKNTLISAAVAAIALSGQYYLIPALAIP